MSVVEYHQKFEELCLYLDRPSNKEKMETFFFGFREDFHNVLSGFNFQSYKEVVEAAHERFCVEPFGEIFDHW